MLKERIKELRLQNHLTQRDLSDKLGLTPKMVSFYELGERVPPPDVLEKLADIFHVTTDYLLCRTTLVSCNICRYAYDPLSEFGSHTHDRFHNLFLMAQEKYGTILSYLEAENLRNESISRFRKNGATTEERLSAYEDYLKYDYIAYLWRNDLDLNLEDFDTYCKWDIGLASTKGALDELDPEVYPKLIEKYGVLEDEKHHMLLPSEKEREIGYDLTSLMKKILSGSKVPLLYYGEPIEEDSRNMLKNALELGIRQIKIEKE